jgi:hypothetical protein
MHAVTRCIALSSDVPSSRVSFEKKRREPSDKRFSQKFTPSIRLYVVCACYADNEAMYGKMLFCILARACGSGAAK